MSRVSLVLIVVAAARLQAADTFPAKGGDIIITPLVHSSVQLEHSGKVMQIDQAWTTRVTRGEPRGAATTRGLDRLRTALRARGIEVRLAEWYPR